MKAVIYLRTSTEEQNPENQLKNCLTLIESNEIKEGEYTIVEERLSAWKEIERPLFKEIINSIKKKEINILIVWDLDRLYRNRKNLLGFFQLCAVHGVKILSYRQKWLTDLQTLKLPTGFEWIAEMQINNFLNFLGWISEDESNKKSDRVKIAFKNHKGKRWGRPKVHTNKINVILEYYNQGLSYRQISEKSKLSIGKISQIINVHKSKLKSRGEILKNSTKQVVH